MTGKTPMAGVNPLVEGLAPCVPYSKMPQALLHEPLLGTGWKRLTPELREPLLERRKEHFFPTSFGINVAMRTQSAVHHSLSLRDPRSAAEQRRINTIGLLGLQNAEVLLAPLSNPATGGILDGWTGSGKSSLIKRILEMIAPDQVIQHSRSEVCGWSSLTQIAYLYLDFPSNGTRGGLVVRILGAIDALIGTDYVIRNRRIRNLDESLLFVMKVLSIHRVGVMVLDETQPETFDRNAWYDELVIYLLGLLNLGIPVVLCGQPRSFHQLSRKMQVSRRFSEIGHFKLRRATSEDAAWWLQELVPGMMRFNVCDRVLGEPEIIRSSRHLAAGVPDFFSRMWTEAQRIALRRGDSDATVTLNDFNEGSRAPEIADIMRAAQWLEADAPDDLAYDDLERAAPTASLNRLTSVPVNCPPRGRLAARATQDAADLLRDADLQRQKNNEKARQFRAKLRGIPNGIDLRFRHALEALSTAEAEQDDLLRQDELQHRDPAPEKSRR